MEIDQYRNKILQGHVIEQLKKLPDNSIDMMITSPPYWGLRDYDTDHQIWSNPADWEHEHCWKEDGKQATKLGSGGITHEINAKVRRPKSSATHSCTEVRINIERAELSSSTEFQECTAWTGSLGLEPTPHLFIKHLMEIMVEVNRVLKPTGTIWINIGDTYASTGGLTKPEHLKTAKVGATKAGIQKSGRYFNQDYGRVKHKSLIGIPDRLKLELIDAGFICRNEIIWHKPNAMPQSASDRFTNDFEKIFFFTMQSKYYFEQQFEPFTDASVEDLLRRKTMTYYKEEGSESKYASGETGLDGDKTGRTRDQLYGDLGKGRNKRTTWEVQTRSFAEAHFAVFPEDLVEIPIKAGSPTEVCTECNKPKIIEYEEERVATRPGNNVLKGKSGTDANPNKSLHSSDLSKYREQIIRKNFKYVTQCDHTEFKPGIVLDIFMGSGTTALVAKDLGRDYVGIELNPEYIDIAEKRIREGKARIDVPEGYSQTDVTRGM